MVFMNVENYCRLRYGLKKTDKPTKAQVNTVSEMCRRGTLDAFRSGRRWIVRLEDGK